MIKKVWSWTLRRLGNMQNLPNNDEGLHNLAVVLVDMQPKFVEGIHHEDLKLIIGKQLRVIELCYVYNIPLVILEYRGNGRTIKKLRQAAQKVPNLIYVVKSRNNGFSGTNLTGILSDLAVEKILLMGICACYCVQATAEAALEKGFKIATSGELIASPARERRYRNIGWYRKNGLYHHKLEPVFQMLGAKS